MEMLLSYDDKSSSPSIAQQIKEREKLMMNKQKLPAKVKPEKKREKKNKKGQGRPPDIVTPLHEAMHQASLTMRQNKLHLQKVAEFQHDGFHYAFLKYVSPLDVKSGTSILAQGFPQTSTLHLVCESVELPAHSTFSFEARRLFKRMSLSEIGRWENLQNQDNPVNPDLEDYQSVFFRIPEGKIPAKTNPTMSLLECKPESKAKVVEGLELSQEVLQCCEGLSRHWMSTAVKWCVATFSLEPAFPPPSLGKRPRQSEPSTSQILLLQLKFPRDKPSLPYFSCSDSSTATLFESFPDSSNANLQCSSLFMGLTLLSRGAFDKRLQRQRKQRAGLDSNMPILNSSADTSFPSAAFSRSAHGSCTSEPISSPSESIPSPSESISISSSPSAPTPAPESPNGSADLFGLVSSERTSALRSHEVEDSSYHSVSGTRSPCSSMINIPFSPLNTTVFLGQDPLCSGMINIPFSPLNTTGTRSPLFEYDQDPTQYQCFWDKFPFVRVGYPSC